MNMRNMNTYYYMSLEEFEAVRDMLATIMCKFRWWPLPSSCTTPRILRQIYENLENFTLLISSPQFEFTNGYEMMHKAWSSIEEVPYCFWRSSVKFQGHTAMKSVEFDPDWAFPDSNSSLNSPMATKWCTKLEVALKRCPIVFEGHPSNFKVTQLKKESILTQIRRFRTVTPVCIHQWLQNDARSLK